MSSFIWAITHIEKGPKIEGTETDKHFLNIGVNLK